MKNKRVFIFLLLFSVLLLQNISAITTNFEVSTLREYDLKVDIISSGNVPEVYDSYDFYDEDDGIVSFDFSSNIEEFILSVFLIKKGEVKYHEKFKNVKAGKDYELIFTPLEKSLEEINVSDTENVSDSENITNDSVTETENSSNLSTGSENNSINETKKVKDIVQETENKAGLISGKAIFEGGFVNSWFFYAIVFIILVIVIVIVYFKTKNREKELKEYPEKKQEEIKIRKLSDFKKEKQDVARTKQERINEIEEKIKQLQEELVDIKKNNKVAELQEKIRKDQEELEKAKREEQEGSEK